MQIIMDACVVWKSLTKAMQCRLNSDAMCCADTGLRMRCKIIRNLVRHEHPATITRILGCSRSQVYRIADRFVESGLEGLVDRREDNGQVKADESYANFIFNAVGRSPRDYEFKPPTWTQELLVIVANNALRIMTSTSTMSRLLSKLAVRSLMLNVRGPKPPKLGV